MGGAVGFIDCHTKPRTNEMEMEEKKLLTRAFLGSLCVINDIYDIVY